MIGVDLLGHGDAPKPHDPAAYADLTARIVEALPDEGPVDAVGFSLGAMHAAASWRRCSPSASAASCSPASATTSFERRRRAATERIIAGVEGDGDPTDNVRPGCSGSTPSSPATTRTPWPRCSKRRARAVHPKPSWPPSTCPVLVVLGDRDFAGPGRPLVDALPDARLVTLRNVDHFATPESFGFIDAMLEFLDAVPP